MLAPNIFCSAGEMVHHEAASLLQRRGEEPAHVLHLNSGRVHLGLVEGGALEHVLGTLEAPFWLNAGSAILKQCSLVDMVAITRVEVLRVPLRRFERSLQALPATALDLLRDVARAHWHQIDLAVSRLGKDAEARCAQWLLRNAEPLVSQPGALAVFLRERKRQIAAQLGIAPETFSRVLRHLRERSLISDSGRVLNLLDPGALRTLAGA